MLILLGGALIQHPCDGKEPSLRGYPLVLLPLPGGWIVNGIEQVQEPLVLLWIYFRGMQGETPALPQLEVLFPLGSAAEAP